MIEEEYDFDTTKIVFSDDNPGKPYVSTLNVEGDETLEKYWASEKSQIEHLILQIISY